MNGKDLLKTQYHFFYRTAKLNLDGLSAEASVAQPPNGANCANWILGHVVHAHNSAMRLVNQEPVWDGPDLERVTEGPVTSADDALDWDLLVSKFLASEARFMAGLEAMDESQLDEGGFTDPFGNAATRGGMLNFLAVHGNYHTGQLGIARRLAGLPGAIGRPR